MIRRAVIVQIEEYDRSKTMWQWGFLETDEVSGTLSVSAAALIGRWKRSLPVNQIDLFQVEMIGDAQARLIPLSGYLPLMDLYVSRWVKIPVLKFRDGPSGRIIRLSARAFEPRKATKTLALELADFLLRTGYSHPIPDLNDETPWKYPLVPVLIGVGVYALHIAVVIGLIALLGAFR